MSDIIIADLDSDGDDDIIVASAGLISWYENDSSSRSVDFNSESVISQSKPFTSASVTDLNNDGDLDIVVTYGNTAGVLVNSGSEYKTCCIFLPLYSRIWF